MGLPQGRMDASAGCETGVMIEVTGLHFQNGAPVLAHLSDGSTVPVTDFIDADGDDCEPEDAYAVTCGADNRWFSVKVDDFDIFVKTS